MSSSLSSSSYRLFVRVPGNPVVTVQAQVSTNLRDREGDVVEEYWRARGSSEDEGDLYTFLQVDFNFPLAEPGMLCLDRH